MSNRIEVSGLITCLWLVLVPSGNPEPDSEADCWREVECGAPVTDVVDGWTCEAGHSHYYYGSPTQQEQERAEAMMEQSYSMGMEPHNWD